ncbi:MAG: EamA family transporter, partial [Stappiaceae bacterium]
SKTEPVQAAVFGLVLLNERMTPVAISAIGIAVVGVMIISVARLQINAKTLLTSLTSRSALIGLLSGALFGVSAVCYRGASLSLGGPGFLVQGAYTLAVVTLFQTLVMLAYMAAFERKQIRAVLEAWRPACIVGLAGVAGSACWFTAMTIQSAAYVRALGQIELVFTFAVSWLFFKERLNRLEFAGIALILGGILLLLLGR